jgi:transcriptional regulator with XRE-family HTH domain
MVAVLEAIRDGTFFEDQGRRILLSRRAVGLSRDYVSRVLKTERKRLTRIEKGITEAKVSELYLLAMLTGQTFGYLTLQNDDFNDKPEPGKLNFRRSRRSSDSQENIGDMLAGACTVFGRG